MRGFTSCVVRGGWVSFAPGLDETGSVAADAARGGESVTHFRTVAVAAIFGLWAPAALATNGMRMTGFGALQDGMGGAGAAAAFDSSTIIVNPAGMSSLGRRFDISGTYFGATVKYSATGAATGSEMKSDKSAMPVPNLGVVLPSVLDERLTVGLGGFAVAGMGVEYGQDLFGGVTETSYTNMRVAPAASYRVTDRLSVGAAINVMYALMSYEVASGMGMVPRDTAGSVGIGATVGVMYRPFDALTLGAAYETHSWFQEFEFDIPAHTVMTPLGPADVPGGTETLDFDQPQMVTVGAAVRPFAGLLLVSDVEWIRWSETNGKNLPEFASNAQLTGGYPWNMSWEDQVVFKVGAEYAATARVRVRAGYNYGKMPLVKGAAFENVAFPAIAEHHVSAGLGFDVGKATINVAGMYSPKATLSGSNPDQGIAAYETTMSQYAFDLGVGYRF